MGMKLRLEFSSSVAKDLDFPELNEDCWASNSVQTRYAVSDGASESFDSKSWARLLVEKYVDDAAVDRDWVSASVDEYVHKARYDELSWSKQLAFDRGSFATLLGIELANNGTDLEVLAIGDSVAFHVSGGALAASYPYTCAEQFDARPRLLSTLRAANEFVAEPGFITEHSSRTWTPKPGDTLILATDAVAQWMLREIGAEQSSVRSLLDIHSPERFARLVTRLRDARRMRVDDATVLRFVVVES